MPRSDLDALIAELHERLSQQATNGSYAELAHTLEEIRELRARIARQAADPDALDATLRRPAERTERAPD